MQSDVIAAHQVLLAIECVLRASGQAFVIYSLPSMLMGWYLGVQDFAARVQGAGFGESLHTSPILSLVCPSLGSLYGMRLHFSGRAEECWGHIALRVGHAKHASLRRPLADEIHELRKREKEQGLEPDWEIDMFMKASAARGKRHSIMTDYVMRMLGLEVRPLRQPVAVSYA